jgi:hypothetical protein
MEEPYPKVMVVGVFVDDSLEDKRLLADFRSSHAIQINAAAWPLKAGKSSSPVTLHFLALDARALRWKDDPLD